MAIVVAEQRYDRIFFGVAVLGACLLHLGVLINFALAGRVPSDNIRSLAVMEFVPWDPEGGLEGGGSDARTAAGGDGPLPGLLPAPAPVSVPVSAPAPLPAPAPLSGESAVFEPDLEAEALSEPAAEVIRSVSEQAAPSPAPPPRRARPARELPKPAPEAAPRPEPAPVPETAPVPEPEMRGSATESGARESGAGGDSRIDMRGRGGEGGYQGGFGGGAGAGDADALRAYASRIMRILERYKKYPPEARQQRRQGEVQVSFTLNRRGTVISAYRTAGSGYRELDEEALALLKRVSPLPAIPASLKRETLTLTVSVLFTLR